MVTFGPLTGNHQLDGISWGLFHSDSLHLSRQQATGRFSGSVQRFFPTRQEGVVRFQVESMFAMLLHHTLLPERILPSIPPEGSASGSRPVSRQRSPPVNPAQHPARVVRPPSASRPVSRQSGPPVDPAQYPARVVRQWIPPSIPPEESASGPPSIPPNNSASGSRPVSRQRSPPVDPAQYPAKQFCQWIPSSIPPEESGSGPVSRQTILQFRQWIPSSIPPKESGSGPVSRQTIPPVDPAEYPARAAGKWIRSPVDPAEYPARAARQWIPPSIPPASGSRRVSR